MFVVAARNNRTVVIDSRGSDCRHGAICSIRDAN